MKLVAGADGRRPQLVRTILPDKLTGVTAAQAITAALFARERTGEGQHIRLSMLDAIVAFLWSSDMGSQTFVDGDLPQQEAASFQDLIYQTTTGYITIAVQNDREWQALIRAVNRPEWTRDPRFLTPELRQQNRPIKPHRFQCWHQATQQGKARQGKARQDTDPCVSKRTGLSRTRCKYFPVRLLCYSLVR